MAVSRTWIWSGQEILAGTTATSNEVFSREICPVLSSIRAIVTPDSVSTIPLLFFPESANVPFSAVLTEPDCVDSMRVILPFLIRNISTGSFQRTSFKIPETILPVRDCISGIGG